MEKASGALSPSRPLEGAACLVLSHGSAANIIDGVDAMMRLIENFRYRPEIDGLRAVAVIAVVAYHGGLGAGGGYVGVDVFFVISGFLITSLIIKDLEEGTFRMARFWERRVRRIMPAMVVVVAATVVAGWFLLLPSDYAELGKSTAFQAAFGANVFFWLNGGYFDGPAEEKPLLHTWSLAVEEQFYLFIPLILFGLFRWQSLRRHGPMLLLFLAGIALSLGASIFALHRAPSATFYLLPTRAWELLCGSCIAIMPTSSLPKGRSFREVAAWAGLCGIVIPCFFYTNTTPFPGLAAVPPCLGTAVLIWATGKPDTADGSIVTLARLLATRPIVFVGLISYSFYLWHWPLFAYSRNWSLQAIPTPFRVGLVAAAFLLAVLSWRFVETPFRKKTVCKTRRAIFAFGGASIAAVFVVGFSLMLSHGIPSRLPPEAVRYANAKNDKTFIHGLTAKDAEAGKFIPIGSPASKAPAVVVWGDSHAMAVMPAFDEVLKEKGMGGLQATTPGVAPVLGARWRTRFGIPEAKAFNDAVFAYITAHKIHDVVLAARWESYTDMNGDVPLDQALLSTIQRLVEAGVRPWVMLQVPNPGFNVPKGLARQSMYHRDLAQFSERPGQWNGLRGTGPSLFEKIEIAGGRILNPRDGFLDSSGKHYVVERKGTALYRDDHHLSDRGARMAITPFLRQSFDP
jgi:peptidoglycan/LPS O-acetylase OafA/YrhL